MTYLGNQCFQKKKNRDGICFVKMLWTEFFLFCIKITS